MTGGALDGWVPNAWVLAAIVAKALSYVCALLAAGGPLFLGLVPEASHRAKRLAVRLAVVAAALGLAVIALRIGLRAGRVSGLGLSGALDPLFLGLVWDTPLGTAALVRAAGYALVLTLLVPRLGRVPALVGALPIAASFAFVGHATANPLWLGTLVAVHTLCAAFWVGALAPLRRDAGNAAAMERFGRVALGTVALLVAAGALFAWAALGHPARLFDTAYGLALLAKIAAVSGLLGLAALNRLRLVPRLREGGSAMPLRRSIGWEMALVAAILVATAVLTVTTAPPVG